VSVRLRDRLLGDPSLTPAERRARANAMWRDPRFVVPYSLFMGVVLVLVNGGGDAGWPEVLVWVLLGAAVMAVVSLITSVVVDPPARRPRP
jgi:hypothetical protein